MKLIELSQNCIDELPDEYRLDSKCVLYFNKKQDGFEIACNINMNYGIKVPLFHIYITQFDIDNGIQIGNAIAIIKDGDDIENVLYNIHFTKEEWRFLKNILTKVHK